MFLGRSGTEWRSDLLRWLGLGLTYYVAARLSLQLALVGENITPLWPPTGIAVVVFLLRGRRLWPGVAVAAFFVNLPISAGVLAAAVTAVGNTLAPLAAATVLRLVRFRPQLDRLRDALAIVLAALGSTLISATFGATTLFATGAVTRSEYPGAWTVWWAGDAMGILVVAPFLLTVVTIRDHPRPRGAKIAEAFVLAVAMVGASSLLFLADVPIHFVVFPVLGYAAWRFQQPGAAPAALLASLFATWAAVEQRGLFADLTLAGEMLTLQLFNASVALVSFFFAAIVSERLHARAALEESASALERRVTERTAELTTANERLAEAQELVHIGSWDWDVATGGVRWSLEMYRIHGIEPDEAMTFERAVALAIPEDRPRIQTNVERAIASGAVDVPDLEYRILRPDGQTRILYGKARAIRSEGGDVLRLVGTVQDVTERRELEREHRIAETLQRALLPESLPELVDMGLAARYVPAEEGSAAGGDWYDVIELPGGRVSLVIGDVAGHGTEAASVMGQVRMAVRAFSLEGHAPATVVGLVHELLRSLYEGEQMVTMLSLTIDPVTWEATVVNAGHPPPLLLDPSGGATFLESPVGLPVGLNWNLPYESSIARLRPGSVLVLYTDGLVDRRDLEVEAGLERLRAAAAGWVADDVDALCGMLAETLLPADAPDDVAMLAARLEPISERLMLHTPADPARLGAIRRNLSRWLAGHGIDGEAAADIVLAASEACANSIEHAYGPGGGTVEIEALVADDEVSIVVRDAGSWRPTRDRDRGRGLPLIRACMDDVDVMRSEAGTEVRMARRRDVVAAR